MARLKIDATKTWIWYSRPSHLPQLEAAVAQLSQDGTVPPRKHHARDLGLQMHYSANAGIGQQQDRLDAGADRLKRNKLQTWPLSTTLKIIKTSVYPAAFHGAEMVYICQDKVNQFRRLVAEAILQTTAKSMSPVLVTVAVHPKSPDQLFLIMRSIKFC